MISRTVVAARFGVCAVVAALLVSTGCGRVAPAAQTALRPSPTAQVVPTAPTVPATAQAPTPSSPSPTVSATPEPLPDPEKLDAALEKVPKKNLGTTSFVVMDTAGSTIVSRSNKPLIPASTMKVVAAMAVLDKIDQDTTFDTRVVSVDKGTIALVGGGDPLLTDATSKSSAKPASLQELAKKTVAALSGKKKVKLLYDASLFSGPIWGTGWRDAWKERFPRISALVVNGGMIDAWHAAPNPAKAAATAFAKRLKASGVEATVVEAGKAPAAGKVLASVTSAPLGTIVSNMLRTSNNVSAEVLTRHLGLAVGGEGSFVDGSAAIRAWIESHGWLDDGVVIDGGSGLSNKIRLTSSLLARVLVHALSDARYTSVVAGLPVAGVNGTLKNRFTDKKAGAGRGVVHAKTGSLNNVSTLAGYVTDKDGAVLVFAAMANKTGGHDLEATVWLDRSASVLAGCGCR